ncbi:MAG TPA: hypothetical protein VN681_05085 [Stellaceae bacterium]|nr:hypothetical protein [Stellaceae bacterium]
MRRASYYVAQGSIFGATHRAARRRHVRRLHRPASADFHEHFDRVTDAFAAERKIKGWRREKKEALIRGDYAALGELSVAYEKRCINDVRPSTGSG